MTAVTTPLADPVPGRFSMVTSTLCPLAPRIRLGAAPPCTTIGFGLPAVGTIERSGARAQLTLTELVLLPWKATGSFALVSATVAVLVSGLAGQEGTLTLMVTELVVVPTQPSGPLAVQLTDV